MEISVKTDIKAATRHLTVFQRRVLPTATAKALNDAAKRGITEAKREVAADLKVAQKYIKKRFFYIKAHRGRMYATIVAKPGAVPTIAVKGGKQTAAGYRAGGRVRKHTFAATMKSGHRSVFVRAGSGHNVTRQGRGTRASDYKMVNGRARRLPIQTSYTGSITTSYRKRRTQRRVYVASRRRFIQRLQHHVNRELLK